MAQVQLTWSDYLTSVSNSYISHRAEDLFTDVTLVSDDNHQVSAHRIILCAGSEYFRNILEDKKHHHPMLCLDGISSGDLNNILDYIYKGELLISEANLGSFLRIATKLKCSGLNTDIKAFQEDPKFTEKIEDTSESFLDPDDLDNIISEAEVIQNEKELYEYNEKIEITKSISENHFENRGFVQNSQVKSELNAEALLTEKTESGPPPEREINNTSKKPKISQYCKVEGQIYSYTELKEMTKKLFERQENGRLKCNYCKYSASLAHNMVEHAEIHINNLEFDCNCCDNVFPTMKQLRHHKYIMRKQETLKKKGEVNKNDEDQAFKDVGKNDTDIIKSDSIIIEHEDSTMKYDSISLSEEYFNKSNYSENDSVNGKLPAGQTKQQKSEWGSNAGRKSATPKYCKVEGQTFSFQELKQMTRKLYTQQSDGRFQCNYCPKRTLVGNHMMEHTQKHIDNLEFECYCCGGIFPNTPSLRGHQVRIKTQKLGLGSDKSHVQVPI